LAGARLFWQAMDRSDLLPSLRLRDLDERGIAYRNTVDDLASLGEFAATIFRNPQLYSNRKKTIIRFLRHAWRRGRKNPVVSYLFLSNHARLKRLGRKHSTTSKRNYVGGREFPDPQYGEYPAGEKRKYFDPVWATDAEGRSTKRLERTGRSFTKPNFSVSKR
jgi:hypothetical protein